MVLHGLRGFFPYENDETSNVHSMRAFSQETRIHRSKICIQTKNMKGKKPTPKLSHHVF